MITLNVYNKRGDAVGTVEIDPEDFGGEINRQLLHDVVLMHLANRRRGTHSTLRRGEVAGSTRKLYRQKGTGRARVGSRRTNKRRGGGTAKGPKPRDYEYHLPKKAVRAATRMAILSKFQDNEAVIVEDLNLSAPKTKEMAGILKALKLNGTSCLIGTAGLDASVFKAARNIDGVEVLPTSDFNTYIVLRQKRLLLTKAALEDLKARAKAARAEAEPVGASA
ncbi:MAG: 50S ribosomal protein L4 [Gemmatales bacterium]|nr:50S ribosomal protein L4 [Gemmatales bacterium]MDW8386814.1 50S ribosomal protein L4 [Gemmatales bacterium]